MKDVRFPIMNAKKVLRNILMTALLPCLIILIFGLASHGRTLTARMLLVTFQQCIVPTILSMAVVGNLTLGMWDFSAGAVVIASSIIGGNLMKLTNTGIPGLFVFCVLIGVGMSSLTGFLNNKLKVPMLVLTIGLIFIYESFPRVIFPKGITIRDKYTLFASAPYNYIVLAVAALVCYFLFEKSSYGHNIRVLGGGKDIAKAAGLNEPRIMQMGFTIAGFFLGLGAFINISEQGQIMNVASLDSSGLVFNALMGYFLAHFMVRYCPLPVALILGNFTMTMLSNGFVALGWPATMQNVTTGFFLLILLGATANQTRFARWRMDRKRSREINHRLGLETRNPS